MFEFKLYYLLTLKSKYYEKSINRSIQFINR